MAKTTELVEVAVTSLRPYDRNAKMHGPEQIEKIKRSIKEFGFVSPCLIDRDLNIIAGHGRVAAAKELGMETVPCVFVDGLSDEQRRAYILADNRLTELGEWDMELVNAELFDLDAMNFDVTLTGFDMPEEGLAGDYDPEEKKKLSDQFLVPPFTVLRGDSADWVERRRLWQNIGIKSEIGR